MTQHTGLIPCKECWQQPKYVKEAKEEQGRVRWPHTVGGWQKGREFFIGDIFASSFAIATI